MLGGDFDGLLTFLFSSMVRPMSNRECMTGPKAAQEEEPLRKGRTHATTRAHFMNAHEPTKSTDDSLPTLTLARLRQSFHRVGRLVAVGLGLALLAASDGPLQAAAIPVPNGSFESPATPYADPRIDSWQKTPKPFWYDESGGFLWDQLTGAFANTPPADPAHIDNCDGEQAMFLFAVPEVGLFQDYDSTVWASTVPTHAFDARFEVGKSYRLTVGVIGGGGNMAEGASLELALYYRDAASNAVVVAATNIVFTRAAFSSTTHFTDIQVDATTVTAGDAWAGQQIGVRLLSTVNPLLAGGYWDLDNVRLTPMPILLPSGVNQSEFGFTLLSLPGMAFEILTTTNFSEPMSSWAKVGTMTNATGTMPFTDTNALGQRLFYGARQMP
jgi:hypothetical protein